jgi:hypothetical protein
MGGFFSDFAVEIFNIPQGFEVVAVGGIGYLGRSDLLPNDLKEREAYPHS